MEEPAGSLDSPSRNAAGALAWAALREGGETLGEHAGEAVGAAIGRALGGPTGQALGGHIGQQLGGRLGESTVTRDPVPDQQQQQPSSSSGPSEPPASASPTSPSADPPSQEPRPRVPSGVTHSTSQRNQTVSCTWLQRLQNEMETSRASERAPPSLKYIYLKKLGGGREWARTHNRRGEALCLGA